MRTDWKLQEEQFLKSGLPLKTFCKQKGLSYASAVRRIKVHQTTKNPVEKSGGTKGSWKHNWSALKEEFLSGNWLSASDFAKDKGLDPKNGNFRKRTVGWTEEKANLKALNYQKTKEEVAQAMIQTNKQWLFSLQGQVGRMIQTLERTEHHFDDMKVSDVKDFRDLNASAKMRLEAMEKAKALMEELTPIPTGEEFKIDDALKRLLEHVAQTGNVDKALNVLKTLSQLKILESGFNWQQFASLVPHHDDLN